MASAAAAVTAAAAAAAGATRSVSVKPLNEQRREANGERRAAKGGRAVQARAGPQTGSGRRRSQGP